MFPRQPYFDGNVFFLFNKEKALTKYSIFSPGRNFNKDGELIDDLWSKSTSEAFVNRSNCMVNQYNEYPVDGGDDGQTHVRHNKPSSNEVKNKEILNCFNDQTNEKDVGSKKYELGSATDKQMYNKNVTISWYILIFETQFSKLFLPLKVNNENQIAVRKRSYPLPEEDIFNLQ